MTHRTPAFAGVCCVLAATLAAQQSPVAGSMEPYTATVDGTEIEIPMVPIPAGTDGFPSTFTIGSPDGESDRKTDEGPQFDVAVEPFWLGKFEITWDAFDQFRREYAARSGSGLRHDDATAADWADAVSVPTPLYEQDSAPILAGMGTTGGYPVANISHLAARQFTKWLSKQTGHFYRLPTEAEWEYAARAGTTTAWSFGDDAGQLDAHAVYFDNSGYDDFSKGHPDFGAGYRKVGSKLANPWGLHDMHGNVAEWVIDRYAADWYAQLHGESTRFTDAIAWPTAPFPCVARGGSWDAEASGCRSAARLASTTDWQSRDPQFPKSVWWYTDAFHVGFRVLRPLVEPSAEEQLRYWEPTDESTLDILTAGGKELRVKIQDGEGK